MSVGAASHCHPYYWPLHLRREGFLVFSTLHSLTRQSDPSLQLLPSPSSCSPLPSAGARASSSPRSGAMESGAHMSGGAGGAVPGPAAGAEAACGGAGGLLCHACGYQYPNAHPSAKQRRAHRKHCGKPASAAATEEPEPEARASFPGEGGGAVVGEGGGGGGIRASAAECGGGSPGSAQEVAGSEAGDVDETENSCRDGAGAQVIIDKCVQAHSDIASEITSETNRADDGGTLNEVATLNSVKASLPEEVVPCVPASAVSSEQLQDVSVPVLPPEPAYGVGVSPELFVSEMQNSNVISVASEATGGEISEQTTEDPVKFGTQVPVGTDGFYSKATDTVKPQEQPDSTSVVEDHLAVSEQIDIYEGEHCPNKDGAIETISRAIGPTVSVEVISVGDGDNITKSICSSDVTMGENIQENVTSNTVVPSQADLVDLSTSCTTHEITDDIEEKGADEIEDEVADDLTTHEMNEVHNSDLFVEKQQDKEITADSISHESNAVCSTDNSGENKNATIAEASSCNIPNTSSIEEEKQIEEVIANPAPEKTSVASNRDGFEENKQIEPDVKTNHDISVVCTTEANEENDTISEINAENIADNVEDEMQSQDITAFYISDGTSMINSSVNEENMHNEDNTKYPSSHEKIVVHCTDNVEEKYKTMVDSTSHGIALVTAIESVEERKNDETSADLTSHGINAAPATENVEEKDHEPILEPLSSKISTVGGVDDVKEKQQNEETTADHISGETSTPLCTSDAEKGIQSKDAATVPISDKSEVVKKTDAVEGTEQNNETSAKEISTIQSMDDLKAAGLNEEIADKEVIVDSDRSHVSLKVLLADKNVETKEKKPSTKDRVLSFRRRSNKDNESPVKPGSPKAAAAGQQDWNSPARLPAEKKSKEKKQQWVPFICCSSIH